MLAGNVFPVMAQESSSIETVVINEVDTNTPGNDAESVSEWVELYNPTNEELYIGGWEIASTSVLKKTLTLSEGITILPGQHLAFSYQSAWFTDVNEIIQLRDIDGNVIDQTPVISDMANDFTSWQRVYDGLDTDSDDDWKFVISTAGSSNGVHESQTEEKIHTVSVSSEKESYIFGETAVISGKVSEGLFIEKPFFLPAEIHITFDGPGYEKKISMYPDFFLGFETSLSLQPPLGITEGLYTVLVEYGGVTSSTQFFVGDEIIIPEELIPVEFEISTDKSNYLPGQTVLISASTNEIFSLESLEFTILNPEGSEHTSGALYPNSAGEFSTTLYMNPLSPSLGNYKIIGKYSEYESQTIFALVEDIKEDSIITLNTDKSVYGLGDTVSITGRINDIWIPSLDLEISQTGTSSVNTDIIDILKILDVVRVDGHGYFNYEYNLSKNTDRLGEYRITVQKDLGTAIINFRVVEDPDNYVDEVFSALSVSTDKNTYEFGDPITFFGKVGKLRTNTAYLPSVSIIILKDGGDTISSSHESSSKFKDSVAYTLTASPDIVGNYQIKDRLYNTIYDVGSYTVKAIYDDGTYSAKSSFEIIDPLDIGTTQAIINLNKSIFGLNENVSVDGLIPNTPQGTEVIITLLKPDGDNDNFGVFPGDDSKFTWSWTTPVAEKTGAVSANERTGAPSVFGTYEIQIDIGTYSQSLFFKVSEFPDLEFFSNDPVFVTTEKPMYASGETLNVFGTVQKRQQGSEGLVVGERVHLLVQSSNYPFTKIFESSVDTDLGGGFKSSFVMPVGVFSDGTYKVSATYLENTSSALFNLENEFVLGGDDDVTLLLDTDKDTYLLGETIHLIGRTSKIIYLDNVEIFLVTEKQNEITCGAFVCGTPGLKTSLTPSPSGSFSLDYIIPVSSDRLGKNEISVVTQFGTFSKIIHVLSTPSITSDPLIVESSEKIIEKFNRISESMIPISVIPKITNDGEFAPRAIQGSVFTPQRDQMSNVNMKITTSGGTCVIGPEPDCLVSESTKGVGSIFKVVEIDNVSYKIRYSGPDAFLEKFTIIPNSITDTLPDSEWHAEIIKDEQPSRFYYKVSYFVE